MELPEYMVPKFSLPAQTGHYSSRNRERRALPRQVDDRDHSRVTNKRGRLTPGSALPRSTPRTTPGRIGLSKYTVPRSVSSRSGQSSHGDTLLKELLDEAPRPDRYASPVTRLHPEPSRPSRLRPEPACLVLDSQEEPHRALQSAMSVRKSEELLGTNERSCQLDRSPNLTVQTKPPRNVTDRDDALTMDCETFYLTPTTTSEWIDAPPLDTPWNSVTDSPFLLDSAVVEETAPERRNLASDKRLPETHSNISTAAPLPIGGCQLGACASVEARLSHVLNAVATAGFSNLSEVIAAHYIESSGTTTDDLRRSRDWVVLDGCLHY